MLERADAHIAQEQAASDPLRIGTIPSLAARLGTRRRGVCR